MDIGVMGGGAAGFFGAVTGAAAYPQHRVVLIEKVRQLLSKVRISGGGRCNVTHACFDPAELVQNYPRGQQALRGPFTRFQPRDTMAWFEARGVVLKTESDGRMFPITDRSETIIDCLLSEAKKLNVDIRTECHIEAIERRSDGYALHRVQGEPLIFQRLLMATGSNNKVWEWMKQLGHTVIPPVPSLFTFNIADAALHALSGVSVPLAKASLVNTALHQTGPLLITHWGLSGPAVLKLSAWGARVLHDLGYQAEVEIDWLPPISLDAIKQTLQKQKQESPGRQVATEALFELPRNLWKYLVNSSGIAAETRWAHLTREHLTALMGTLKSKRFPISGKSTYKDEFVTCGGVKLDEVNFKTMESKICPGLYFAGEILDIDGVTGGFNFQNAWTTGWTAGQAIGRSNK